MVICTDDRKLIHCTGSPVCLEVPGQLLLAMKSLVQYSPVSIHVIILYMRYGLKIWKHCSNKLLFRLRKELLPFSVLFPEVLDAEGMKICWSIVSLGVICLLAQVQHFACYQISGPLVREEYFLSELRQNWSINQNTNIWSFVSSDDKMFLFLQWAVLDAHGQNWPPDANFCYNILLKEYLGDTLPLVMLLLPC